MWRFLLRFAAFILHLEEVVYGGDYGCGEGEGEEEGDIVLWKMKRRMTERKKNRTTSLPEALT